MRLIYEREGRGLDREVGVKERSRQILKIIRRENLRDLMARAGTKVHWLTCLKKVRYAYKILSSLGV